MSVATRIRGFLAVLALSLLSACSSAAPETTERFSILGGGEVVGTLVGVTNGDAVAVDYAVDNNGRGPKHREQIRLGAGGIPVSWTIQGTSLMGGAVDEEFAWHEGHSRWRSQADQGERDSAKPQLYVVNDGSAWATGIYARALLQSPDQTLDVLPGGMLRLEKLRDWEAGGDSPVAVTVYRMTGVGLAPTYLMLDRKNRLFAEFGESSLTIREGYEQQRQAIQALAGTLEMERAEHLQKTLAHRHASPVRLRNVRIFDPRTGVLGEPSSVVVAGERIVSIDAADAPAADGGEVVYDGQGGTLVPGLHDMHSHSSLDSGLWYLAAGITSTRDMGNANEFLLDLMDRLESGSVAGPRIVRNGFLEGRSPYSARNGFVADSLEKALEAVNWYAERGYWQIKIYNSMTPAWVKPIAAEAHRLGLGVTGHVPAFTSPDQMILDGYDEVAHINQVMLHWLLEEGEDTRTPLRLTAMARAADLDLTSPKVQKTLALMAERGTALDPTAVILERLMLSRAGMVAPGDEHFLEHMPIGYQRYRKRTYVPDLTPAVDQAYRDGVVKMLQVIKQMHDKGIRLLPGTDDGTGFTVHRELELYTLAGLTPAESLRLGTLGAEEYLKRDADLGSIETGKLADFFLIAGDPTRDINAIRKARLVMKGGVVYLPSEIYAALGVRPFADAPPVE